MKKTTLILFLFTIASVFCFGEDMLVVNDSAISRANINIRLMTNRTYYPMREEYLREVERNPLSKKGEWLTLFGLLKNMSQDDSSYKANEKYAIYKFFAAVYHLLPTEPENYPLEIKNHVLKCLDSDFNNYSVFSMSHMIHLLGVIGKTEDFRLEMLDALGKIITHSEIRRTAVSNLFLQNAFISAAEILLPLVYGRPAYDNSIFVSQIVVISEKTEWGNVQTRRVQELVQRFTSGEFMQQ